MAPSESGVSAEHPEVDAASLLEDIDLDRLALSDRVPLVSMALLFASGLSGLRAVKTAEIAKLAHTTESTLFRHFSTLEAIIDLAVEWSWKSINTAISQAEFDDPSPTSYTSAVERDIRAVLSLFDDPAQRLAGTGAFLSYRRPNRLSPAGPSASQRRFDRRLRLVCERLYYEQTGSDGGNAADHLATFLTNYLASVWFTWLALVEERNSPSFVFNRDYVIAGVRSYLSQIGVDAAIA